MSAANWINVPVLGSLPPKEAADKASDVDGWLGASDEAIEQIKALDPLSADDDCSRLPEMNRRGDVGAIAAALRAAVPSSAGVAAFSPLECLAAMRDLGMLLGSLKRHGVEPARAVPEVISALLELGRRTGMVPRDTVHHYATWNPQGHRRRTFTGDPQEAALQDSVRAAFPELRDGIEQCERLREVEPEDPLFAPGVARLGAHVEALVGAFGAAARGVSPAFFARTLRAYFDRVDVGGTVYLGPGASQLPLWLIDQAVWASDSSSGPGYAEFVRDSALSGLPRWRGYFAAWAGRPSLVGRLTRAFREASAVEGLQGAADALACVLRAVVVFRGRHLAVVRQAYSAEVRVAESGSGGGSAELLSEILELTRQNALLASGPTNAR
jgi:hypothetical protein